MIRIVVLLAVLGLLYEPAFCSKSDIVKENVSISSFKASMGADGTIVFPSDTTLPPVLRSLMIKPSESGLMVEGPYLDVPGKAMFRPKNTLILIFDSQHIRISLTVVRRSPTALTLRGKGRYVFRRPFGMRLHRSRLTVPEGVAAAKAALDDTPYDLRLITVVDHAAAADSVGLSLPGSSVVVFGNPAIGSKLWSSWPPVGIDLPMEILVASSPLGVTYVGWNAYSSLLRKRMGITGAAAIKVLNTIDDIHALIGSAAADRPLKASGLRFDSRRIGGELDGIEVATMKGDALAAYDRLVAALEAAPPVNIAYKFLHDELAKKAGTPTGGKVNRVIVFGNPAAGTKIMQRAFTAALDLPLRMAVWTTRRNAKRFTVGYTTLEWISRRHDVEVPEMLSAALANFASVTLGA